MLVQPEGQPVSKVLDFPKKEEGLTQEQRNAIAL
jgi:hypothetical protein